MSAEGTSKTSSYTSGYTSSIYSGYAKNLSPQLLNILEPYHNEDRFASDLFV
jgi:hypothetical protein